MKLKLDENLGHRGMARLQDAGHDVSTVALQKLNGAADEFLFRICTEEKRALVTLDFDFSQVIRFPPNRSAGIAILSSPGRMTAGLMDLLLDQLIVAMASHQLAGRLWIVEPARIRIHADDEE